jgi:SpoVK/Ycf46/Vps4 family AAA+-type ATPase
MDEIEVLIRARYPILYLVTWEEERAEERLAHYARKMNKKVFSWSVNRGLTDPGANLQSRKKSSGETADPLAALNEVVEMQEPALFIFKDFHPYLGDPAIVRRLRELSSYLKSSHKTLVLVSPKLSMPCELEKDIAVVDFPLPSYQDQEGLLDQVVEHVGSRPDIAVEMDASVKEAVVKAALGLTFKEAENVLARTLITRGKLDAGAVEVVLTEKKQLIRKSGILEYYDHAEGLESVGGMENLKNWLLKRTTSFSEKARQFGLPSPRGVLLLGVQGCGKSLCAKSIAAMWRQPLLRLDMGSIFSSLVGSSEENLRRAIRTAESIAPAVLWVDEIEKAFSGTQSSSQSDAGTTSRVFGTFLTWLQEKKKPVFVVATANNITQLPPELLRKGRLDEIFFVDLPRPTERAAIFRIHLAKKGRNPEAYDLTPLVQMSEGFSGSEIEQAVVSALHDAFFEDRELEKRDLLKALEETVPLSRTMSEPIEAMRQWAVERARPAAAPEAIPAGEMRESTNDRFSILLSQEPSAETLSKGETPCPSFSS